jgi:inner membrane protein
VPLQHVLCWNNDRSTFGAMAVRPLRADAQLVISFIVSHHSHALLFVARFDLFDLTDRKTPMIWFLIFAATVFSLYFWRQHIERQRELNSPLASHRSGHSHIGQVIVLEKGLHNGAGQIRLGNRDWPVRGPNLPPGAKARVTGVDGTILLVDRVAA